MRALLLIDDDDDMRTTLEQLLTDEGFEVHTARNGKEGLERLRTIDPPGLILLDLMMPVMTGSEFLAERRRDRSLSRIPVVIMSAWTRGSPGAVMGVERVLTKPVQPEELLAVVQRYCDRRDLTDLKRR